MDISKEEKKAISIVENIKFKKYKIYIAKEMKDEIRFYQTEEERKAIDIVLNLIEKLQKENIKLKQEQAKRSWIHVKENGEVEPLLYISKDKIRELLKEHNIELGEDTIAMSEQGAFAFMLSIKELLEEE